MSKFQKIAANDSAKDDDLGRVGGVDEAGRDGLGNPADLGRSDEVENARHHDGRKGGEDPSGDDRGDDISRVVKAVRVVEESALERRWR